MVGANISGAGKCQCPSVSGVGERGERGGCDVLCEADLGCLERSEQRSRSGGLSDLTWPGWDDQLVLVAPPVIDLGTTELNHR